MLHCVKGANNRLSNGIVPLQIVCEQVGSLGVPTRQVSTGLNNTGVKSQARLLCCAYRLTSLVWKDKDRELLHITYCPM